MGAISFIEEREGKDVISAFSELVAEEEYEKGNDIYNGGVNNCNLGKCTLRFDKFNKGNINKAMKHIEEKHGGQKYIAAYVDLGICGYEVTTVKTENNKSFSNPKYKMKYVVKLYHNENILCSKDTLKEAREFSKEYSLKNNTTCSISKEYVNINKNKNNNILYTDITSKIYKSKPKLKPMKERAIKEIHKYLFYGYAPW